MDFETASNGRAGTGSDIKYSLRRVEPSVKKFVKVLQIDLERLKRHCTNVERFQVLGEYSLLHKEQINATRTVQQLKANMRQLEQTRAQVQDHDLPQFDAKVRDIQVLAVSAVKDFLSLQESSGFLPEPLSEVVPPSGQDDPHNQLMDGHTEISTARTSDAESLLQEQQQLVLDHPLQLGVDETSQRSWQELQSGLEDLNSVIHTFADLVQAQREQVDHIEDNVEVAHGNVIEGATSLTKAAKWKAAAFPVTGALLGGLVGGPVGLVAGLKLGGLAAVGGGLAGFTGGHLMKQRQNRITEMELQNLSKKGSRSLPEIPQNRKDSGAESMSTDSTKQ